MYIYGIINQDNPLYIRESGILQLELENTVDKYNVSDFNYKDLFMRPMELIKHHVDFIKAVKNLDYEILTIIADKDEIIIQCRIINQE